MNRGSDPLQDLDQVLGVASMRPRFMNRGSQRGAAGRRGGLRDASMRPRFMNRGSEALEYEDKSPSFASMRPRFMNRGSDATTPGPRQADSLQ